MSPRVSMAPATVILSVMVEPDERNRALRVVADSPDFYSSSEVRLEGEDAARLQRFTLRNLPAGEYVVRAQLFRADESEKLVETQLIVTGY